MTDFKLKCKEINEILEYKYYEYENDIFFISYSVYEHAPKSNIVIKAELKSNRTININIFCVNKEFIFDIDTSCLIHIYEEKQLKQTIDALTIINNNIHELKEFAAKLLKQEGL